MSFRLEVFVKQVFQKLQLATEEILKILKILKIIKYLKCVFRLEAFVKQVFSKVATCNGRNT